MSDVIDAIEKSFKNEIALKPFRSVTVKDICEGAFISRRTFYANFVDKRAVVAYLIRRDAIEPMSRALELLSAEETLGIAPAILESFYGGIYDNADFYSALVKPMCGVDPTFELVVARALRKVVEEGLLRHCPSGITANDKKQLHFGAYYHAAAQAIVVEKWIYDNFDPPVQQMAEYQARIIAPSLAQLAGLR